MIKILVVEDEPGMRTGLKDNLEFEGYDVTTEEEGDKALDLILKERFSLIILDVMLPGMSGFDICKTARKEGVKTPIILLTAKGEEIDKVLGLELGADDYVTKPFSLRELLARIKAILRRSGEETAESSSETGIGKLFVNFSTYNAFEGDRQVQMSHKEFEILKYLYNNRNKTVSRDELLNNIWGEDVFTTSRTIDNFILKLRQKIEKDHNHPEIILTVHGIGYKLIG
jgi:DNA-binding response OmpR family regulator